MNATPPTATSAPTREPHSRSPRKNRMLPLALGEWKQFRRNKVIVFMVILVLIFIPLSTMGSVGGSDSPEKARVAAAFSLQLLLLMAVTYVLFYSVLSMATTRRDEGVLKRLRTGEARDRDILIAICMPSAVFVLIAAIVTPIIVMVMGSAPPVNVGFYILAVLCGIVLGATTGFITSTYTKNAEAAQVTSFPVVILAMLSLTMVRPFLPDALQVIGEKNPFGLMLDLVNIGWAGVVAPEPGENPMSKSFADTLREGGLVAIQLVVWCVALVYVTQRVMRWDPR
ncbi:membrane protein [Corynebacterium falsenii DSM 44353]|nr:membrane protein [Corynebacterium falsenii DSM 44353]